MWLLVINSHAGKGKAVEHASEFAELLVKEGIKFEIINEITFDKTVEQLRSKLESNEFTRVIAAGGDGLVNLCLQYVANTGVSLGVLPSGTGNDFARSTGVYNLDIEQIFNLYVKTSPTQIDLGRVKGSNAEKWFVQVLSTGFDAEVNALANLMKWPRGKSRYTIATIRAIANFKPLVYKINIDGVIYDQQAMLLAIANGETYGGGMKICPGASNSDGAFDILLVKPVSRFVLLTIFPKVFSGKHITHSKILNFKGKNIIISAPTVSFADGEFVSDLPIEISNISNSLNTWLV